jgi:hypothetical protein
MKILLRWGICGWICLLSTLSARPATSVYLQGVPDYGWYYGCFGTATGNLMGFWDRNGFPDFYTGPTGGGLAPLNTTSANSGIVALWASKAGIDGRPADKPGHLDDYWAEFENTGEDPYAKAQRPEHDPDCIGDFIGLSQRKWTNMAGECNGNIDGFCFVYWATNGDRRVNFTPDATAGEPALDLQSGLRNWTQYRGYDAEVFTQLVDVNPNVPSGTGFTFQDLKAEIDKGYPVLLFLQGSSNYRTESGEKVNPSIHGMLAYGYYLSNGKSYVRYRTSWASGDNSLHEWISGTWEASLPLRGVIGYHPVPKIRKYSVSGEDLTITWDGPSASLYDSVAGGTRAVHGYVVEVSVGASPFTFMPVSPVLTTTSFTLSNCPSPAFVRIRLVTL